MIKKVLVTVVGFSLAGCAAMKFPDYAEVKASPYYTECREFSMDVYKNNGYSKLGNTVILNMNDTKAMYIVRGCVAAMGKNSVEEAKADINSKASTFGLVSGACYNAECRVDTEQQMKAYNLGSYYAATKKFPDQMKPNF
ncbi:hypothetical protein ACUN3I_00020 [Hafnia alvei]|uniref:hypothetical protein n=1 Tax=Hafnia alvei TaxID=569 RepID=UPI00061D2267|nr:hypothetical protein [Hafnia alvei]KKF38909.1 hypothetical protein PU01_20445 [Hafnia alvei]MBW3474328.1 hypothetical protein [Hafnia alvei]